MRTIVVAAAVLLGGAGGWTQEQQPPMPKPQQEHEWLHQLVGEWDAAVEMVMEEGKPPQKSKGTETGRMIGGFWAHLENRGEFQGSPFVGFLTLGYDPDKKRFIGTWFDSMSHTLWRYEGTLDSKGKILTLETEGPCPMEPPGTMTRFRETLEIVSPDHKVFTSHREKDGRWVKVLTIHYTKQTIDKQP
ncbi:MAG: DUF1579 domain-containing protein [Planctomycetes bacterium]|nr:DUF1579 domain-containing protein [Planctomycetota bacterium]